MSEHYREERWLQVGLYSFVAFRGLTFFQSHDLQEVQIRILLGVYGYDFDTPRHLLCPDLFVCRSLGRAWDSLVFLQSV
jgi:hypothetical protein